MNKRITAFCLAAFIVATATLCWASEGRDHICFRALDSNQDGIVTMQEFETFYPDGKEKFNQADLNKDGKLTHDEYHDYLGHGSS